MIEFRTFGVAALMGTDGEECRSVLERPKLLGLLSFLAGSKPHGYQRRDTLLSQFWPDVDQDRDYDLVIIGEWMPITIFIQEDGIFQKLTNEGNGLDKSAGWWYSIATSDIDKDGDMDLVAGNLGLNYKYKASEKEPFEVYAGDFDQNNRRDIIFAYYQDGKQYPVVDRVDLISAIPDLKSKFPKNDPFSVATLQDIFEDTILAKAARLEAYNFASAYIENLGDGNFRIKPLGNLAQLSSQNATLIEDVDQDGYMDIIMAGNNYASEAETIRNDAGIGILLKGDGTGNFKTIPFPESGLYADGDIKSMEWLKTPSGKILVCARNNDFIKFIRVNQKKLLAEVH